jgi:hypothetical protein
MSNRLRPLVGHWYNHLDKGDLFQVVALDAQSGTIEIQEFDGALDELDAEEWLQMDIEPAAAPEDWTGPVDELEPDDRGFSDMSSEEPFGEQLEAVTTWEEAFQEEEEQEDIDDAAPARRPTLRSPRPARHHH